MSRALRFAVLAGLLASPACGARWSDEQRDEVVARGQGAGAEAAGDGGTSGAATAGSVAGGAATPGATTGTGGATGSGGGLGGGTADPASGPVGVGGGPLPCAATSDAPGVTDTQITIASVSALSGPVPGLGRSSADATRAYVAYRNATGGVCGRQIVLREADDGTDISRYRAIVSELAPQVLGIAGGFTVGDAGGEDVIREHGLPVVTVPGTEAIAQLPTVFDVNPGYDDLGAVIGKYRFLVEQGATTVAMAYLAVDQSRAEAIIQRQLMEAAGLRIVSVQELPISTLSFDSTARAVANSGADYLFFIGDANSNVSMARSMGDTDHAVEVAEYFTFAYGTSFIEAVGSASEGATTWLRTLPNEEAGSNAEMATFLDWMDQVASDDVRDVFAADAWAGTKAFFDALEALPGPISREALVDGLAATGTYDAGGMLGPIRLGAERTNGCFVGMQVQSGEWRRLAPASGFLCV